MKRSLMVLALVGFSSAAGCCWRPAWCNQQYYPPQQGYAPAPTYYPAPTATTVQQPIAPCTCN